LVDLAEKTRIWDINSPKAKAINGKIGEIIVINNQPFSEVEDKELYV